jgi:hypothetical protein
MARAFFTPYEATRMVRPLRVSSSKEYLPAIATANCTGLSSFVSTTLYSPSSARRIVSPGVKGTNGFFTFTVECTR